MKRIIDGIVMVSVGTLLITQIITAETASEIMIGWGISNIIYQLT